MPQCITSWLARLGLPLLLLTWPLATHAEAEWVEDAFTGSCKALLQYQAAPGVRLDGESSPGKWGVTKPTLLLGSRVLTEADPLADLDARVGPPKKVGKKVCVTTTRIDATFDFTARMAAIEWKHGRKPDSACAKEWARVSAIIHAHEPRHVKDVADVVKAANDRVKRYRPITACGDTAAQAQQAAADAVVRRIEKEVDTLKKALDAKSRLVDREEAFMDCSKCQEGLSFKDVTIDCTIKTPQCSVKTSQKISGQTCEQPVGGNWNIKQRGFAEGCGMPSTANASDEVFDNDCVAAGSKEERDRVAVYKAARGTGAAPGGGGWMCVYTEGATPKITIRNFRVALCDGAAEQSVTVEAQPAEGCGSP